MRILVTGSAGFIGSAVALSLLKRGDTVIGIDNLNDYYDVNLKLARLARTLDNPKYLDFRCDIANGEQLNEIFRTQRPERVIHLAAQAGVRYSLTNPLTYVQTNLVGFAQILEACRNYQIEHLVYASSSSVYGANTRLPFSIHHAVDHPVSLYAATKKSNELMAHTYSHLYQIPTTGLRFFTVYGPWGRPDMALFRFTRAILAGQPVQIFNHGKHQRDFTYIDDIVAGVLRVLDRAPTGDLNWSSENPDPASSRAPYHLYNLGSQRPIELLEYLRVLEQCLGRSAQIEWLPLQPGDVPTTFADISELIAEFNYQPTTSIETGVAQFVDWYQKFY